MPLTNEMVSQIVITGASMDDLDAMMRIEAQAFPVPWSKELFIDEFEGLFSHVLTAKDSTNNMLCGYLCFSVILDEFHILNIAVDETRRREKIATKLLLHSIDAAKEMGAKIGFLEVRESHAIARAFYNKIGFDEVARRKKYYSDNKEDAIIMVKTI